MASEADGSVPAGLLPQLELPLGRSMKHHGRLKFFSAVPCWCLRAEGSALADVLLLMADGCYSRYLERNDKQPSPGAERAAGGAVTAGGPAARAEIVSGNLG